MRDAYAGRMSERLEHVRTYGRTYGEATHSPSESSASSHARAYPIFGEEKPRLRLVHPRRGVGFCWPCYDAGQTVLAVDPINGDACAHHLREKAS